MILLLLNCIPRKQFFTMKKFEFPLPHFSDIMHVIVIRLQCMESSEIILDHPNPTCSIRNTDLYLLTAYSCISAGNNVEKDIGVVDIEKRGPLCVVAPSVITLSASIKLGGCFIRRSSLEHPPIGSPILALWAVYRSSWKCLNTVALHDFERNILIGFDVYFFSTLIFNPFSLKPTFWTRHALLISRWRSQAGFAFRTKTHRVWEPRYLLMADLTMLRSSLEYSCAEVDASCITSIGSFLFVATLN
jgi:hypothetical protein